MFLVRHVILFGGLITMPQKLVTEKSWDLIRVVRHVGSLSSSDRLFGK